MSAKPGLSKSGKLQNCLQAAEEVGSMGMGITQQWGGKKLHYETIHNLYFSLNLIRITKSSWFARTQHAVSAQ
jgi:hypothetical protein